MGEPDRRLRITVEGLDSGERHVVEIEDTYLILACGDCVVSGVQTYATGTHQLTIKNAGGGSIKQIEEHHPDD